MKAILEEHGNVRIVDKEHSINMVDRNHQTLMLYMILEELKLLTGTKLKEVANNVYIRPYVDDSML